MLCGIDEAGRGCLAGPLLVAGVVLNNSIEGLDDSKKLSEKKRLSLYDKIKENSIYHIVSIDNNTIDEIGLSKALQMAIKEIMQNIDAKEYLMDGNTSFGIDNLSHMIQADSKVQEVSAASILAKVTRDEYMKSLNDEIYGFSNHKGYGTKAHVEAIRVHGHSDLHRKSFQVKSLIQPTLF
jgi:ribonuclease HII